MSRSKKPLLLDLFCGAGGCAVGYSRAGFDVVGVDRKPQPRYPFPLIVDDALDVLRQLAAGWSIGPAMPSGERYQLHDFATIHASPPCQAYSITRHLKPARQDHADLIEPTRTALIATRKSYVIENVPGAPLARGSALLCGLSFGLKLFRHRLFESNVFLFEPPHIPHEKRRIGKDGMACVVGDGGNCTSKWNAGRHTSADCRRMAAWKASMGIDWMVRRELSQAIPPAYTEYIGRQFIRILEV